MKRNRVNLRYILHRLQKRVSWEHTTKEVIKVHGEIVKVLTQKRGEEGREEVCGGVYHAFIVHEII